VGNGPEMVSIVMRLGGRCSTTSQVYTYSRPIERRVVRTVVPTPIGSGELSPSLSTLSSQRGRFRASSTKAKTSSTGRKMTADTRLVNIAHASGAPSRSARSRQTHAANIHSRP
jgi:S-adenosylmethionine synthetase